MTSTKYQVLARRYRPQRFSEVVGQESVVTTLKNALRYDKAAHAYLFSGSRGVGKTTLARLFAKALNCLEKGADMEPCNRCSSCLEIGTGQSLDVIEIDGASNRGIDDIREINETALYSPSQGRYKIYIIDEVHMLTKEAFNALLKTLEEPPQKAKFFFATTEPHKVLPTIISRCQRFDLGRIQLSQIIEKLDEIAKDLSRSVDPEALHLIAAFSDGSLRDAESIFDQILCFAEGSITAAIVRTSLGLIPQEHFFALDQAFSEAGAAFAFELVETLFTSGKDLPHFYEQLIEHVRNLSSARLLGEKGLSLPPELTARYLQSSRLYGSSQCLYLLEYLLRSEQQFQKSACQRVALEAILLHYIQSKHRIPMEILVRRLSELEDALRSQPAEPLFAPKEESRALNVDKQSKIDPVEEGKARAEKSAPEKQTPAESKECVVKSQESKPDVALLYRNNLKNREFDQEVPQNLRSERAPRGPQRSIFFGDGAIAPTQGASENKNAEAKPTPSKTDSSSCFGMPKSDRLISLKPTPFNPYHPRKAIESTDSKPEPTKVENIIPPQQTSTPLQRTEQDSSPKVVANNQTHYDTLMRFAAVELEGTLKIN